jgi:hypothetical protein
MTLFPTVCKHLSILVLYLLRHLMLQSLFFWLTISVFRHFPLLLFTLSFLSSSRPLAILHYCIHICYYTFLISIFLLSLLYRVRYSHSFLFTSHPSPILHSSSLYLPNPNLSSFLSLLYRVRYPPPFPLSPPFSLNLTILFT